MRMELDKMLRWCLTESLRPDGSCLTILPDASLEEAEYFGVAFLARIGYFDRQRRFWTGEEFPEAESVRKKLLAYIGQHRKSGGAGGYYYDSVLDELR